MLDDSTLVANALDGAVGQHRHDDHEAAEDGRGARHSPPTRTAGDDCGPGRQRTLVIYGQTGNASEKRYSEKILLWNKYVLFSSVFSFFLRVFPSLPKYIKRRTVAKIY